MLGHDTASNTEMSYEDKVKARRLATDRVSGRFKDDVNGFTMELLEL